LELLLWGHFDGAKATFDILFARLKGKFKLFQVAEHIEIRLILVHLVSDLGGHLAELVLSHGTVLK